MGTHETQIHTSTYNRHLTQATCYWRGRIGWSFYGDQEQTMPLKTDVHKLQDITNKISECIAVLIKYRTHDVKVVILGGIYHEKEFTIN